MDQGGWHGPRRKLRMDRTRAMNDVVMINMRTVPESHGLDGLDVPPPDVVPEPVVELRSYFPETWLWKLSRTGWVPFLHS